MQYHEPRHFRVEEFLPPGLYNELGKNGLYRLVDPRILWTMDALRGHFAVPITINNYHLGGHFMQRGFRDDPTVGSKISQHRFGRACDFDIREMTAEEFRTAARSGTLNDELRYITRIEDGINWCHIDCAGIQTDKIVFFNP